ncbi:MAG: phosphohydrolase, partial [Chloroflexi bacterium]|nr:phosphohydrolase [Chloroflexota bacterium]
HAVEITVTLNNSAGIFQIEDTLAKRLRGSPLASYVNIVVFSKPEGTKTDMRIIERLSLENGSFKVE